MVGRKVAGFVPAMMVAVALVVTPGQPAAGHPGGTDSSGCHTCRTNCTEKYGIPYGDYHCHGGGDGGGGGGSATTGPPPTDPPATEPPATAPRTTSGGSRSTTTAPATTTTTDALDEPPEPATLFVEPASSPEGPATVVEIQGEPRARYRALVESEPQEKTGRLNSSGTATVEFLVENGDHTLTVELEDAQGNVSEATTQEFTVDLPPPERPRAELVSEEGASPVRVRVTGGPPVGRAVVTVDGGDEHGARLDDSGRATVEVEAGGGEHTLLVAVEDFQGQRSGAVRLTAAVDDGDSAAAAGAFVVAAVIAGTGAAWMWRRRVRSRAAA